MLTLHTCASNEQLLKALIIKLKQQPLENIFAQDVFLIQTQGVERWLSQQLAQEFKIWGNYQFSLVEPFFKQLSRTLGHDVYNPELTKESMLWSLEALLRDLNGEVFKPLQHYLTGNNIAIKRYQLAQHLAQLFEHYQFLRVDLLNDWQHGFYQSQDSSEAWQAALWLKLIENNDKPHQGLLWQQLIQQLNHTAVGELKYRLPPRIILFGVSFLAPLTLDYLNALARHTQIEIYWLTALPLNTHENLHPLLTTLGKQGLDFQQLFIDRHINFQHAPLATQCYSNPNNLQQLQQDLHSQNPTRIKLKPDNSISLHACHSKMREVEVLKNTLTEALDNDPKLQLRDIVVVAPKIQAYAPFIDAVFQEFPHTITGHNLRLSSPLLEAFIGFLHLADSRFGWQEVFDLLEQAIIYESFDLSAQDVELIRNWLDKTYLRWGKSGEHKQQLDLPPLTQNTWQASLERLFMGYAIVDDAEFVDGVLPYIDLEGAAAQALGGLNDFIQLLFKASAELTQAHPLSSWANLLNEYASCLFSQTKPSELQILQQLLADFSDKLAPEQQQKVELAVITRVLEAAIEDEKSSSGLLRGKLTFCALNNVRSLPFKVIAVLGMNDGDFPSADKYPTFDFIGHKPRLGDLSRRNDDRQQFLELLLCAKQQLIITYVGQSLSQNQTIPPTVVISELLDVLEQHYQLKDLTLKQPLQAFSSRYFDGKNSKLLNYSQTDALTAQTLIAEKAEITSWWQGNIAQAQEDLIELKELFSFYRHPQRYFIRRQLDVYFQGLSADAEEHEPFAIEGLENYAIQQNWIESLLQQQDFSLEKLQAQGCWLSGVMGKIRYVHQEIELLKFVESIQALELGEPLDGLAIEIQVEGIRLTGKLHHRYQNGSLFYRFAKLKGKDFICALLHHCLINQHTPQNTYLISKDELLCFTPEQIEDDFLPQLINLYQQGLKQPNAWFSDIALDYVKQVHKLNTSTRTTKPAIEVAQEKLKLALEQDFELELKRLFQHTETIGELLTEEFEPLCKRLLLPLWEANH